MFQPTHHLVSKTRRIPVQLITTPQGASLLTEDEWRKGTPPAFSIHPKRGFFCHDVQVLGFNLEPIEQTSEQAGGQANEANSSANLQALSN